MFYLGSSTPGTGGLADHGTRLMVRLTGLAAGAQVFAGIYEAGANDLNSRVRLVSTDATGAGAFNPRPATTTAFSIPAAAVTASEGTATIVYEVMSSLPSVIETIDVPIYVTGASVSTVVVTGGFAPASSVTTASATAPRFVDVPTAPAPPLPAAAWRSGNLVRIARMGTPTPVDSSGFFASAAALAMKANGDAFAAAIDTYGSPWINVLRGTSSAWTGWQLVGGRVRGDPAIAADSFFSHVYVSARDEWNSYWLLLYTPETGLASWLYLAGIFSSDPVIATAPNGAVYIVGKDSWNALWSARFVPGFGFQGWRYGGGIIKGKPAVTVGTDGAAYIAARDNWDSLWMARVKDDTWTGWSYGGGIMKGDPQIATVGDGSVVAVLSDPGSGIWTRGYDEGPHGGWRNWHHTGGVLAGFAAAGSGGNLYIAGLDAGSGFWWYEANGNQWSPSPVRDPGAGAIAAAPR
jgi:hypothetical protein